MKKFIAYEGKIFTIEWYFDARGRSVAREYFDGLTIPFINVRELILSKINTGRKKDEADVEELQKILNLKKP